MTNLNSNRTNAIDIELTSAPKIGATVKTKFGTRTGKVVEISDNVVGMKSGHYFLVEFEVNSTWTTPAKQWMRLEDLRVAF